MTYALKRFLEKMPTMTSSQKIEIVENKNKIKMDHENPKNEIVFSSHKILQVHLTLVPYRGKNPYVGALQGAKNPYKGQENKFQ